MLLNKADLPMVAMDFMNDVHLEDVEMLNALNEKLQAYVENPTPATKQGISAFCETFYTHTVAHFNGEEVEMQRTGFPPYFVHKGEHERFLNVLRSQIDHFNHTGDGVALQKFIAIDVVSWFLQHVQTMDTVTAMFLKTGKSPCGGH